MPTNVYPLRKEARRRVLVAHQRGEVRHALRTLIETEKVVVVEVVDGEGALCELEYGHFDLLVLQLDLPIKDGLTVMQLHRMLLAHERTHIEPPAIVFTLPPEVRGNVTLIDHLRGVGVDGLIDDSPRPEAAGLLEDILRARAERLATGRPAVA